MTSRYSDAEQVDALKEWWKENGQSVVAGVIIGVGGLIGWKGWNAWQQNQAENASLQYSALQQGLETDNHIAIDKASEILRESYASTPYASLAALAQARLSAEQGDTEAAVEQLEWVVENAAQQYIAQLAKIRLARLLVAMQDYDKGLSLLDGEIPQSFTSLASEIRGDALAAKGETDKAREAYNQALIGAQGQTQFLRMKRDQLVTEEFETQNPTADSS